MAYSRQVTDAIYTEIRDIAATVSTEFADRLPESNYSLLSLYTMILPAIFSEVTSFVLPQAGAIGPAWNYADAACSAITGVNQLLDNQTHRPVVTKLKGAMNIGTAAQLTTLTALNFSLLGGPGFAAAFGAGFILSLDETARAFRRKYDYEYWLQDSLAALEKLAASKQALQDEINLQTEAGELAAGRWLINRKKNRLSKLSATEKELENDVLFTVAAERFKKFENDAKQPEKISHTHHTHAIIEKQLNARSDAFQKTEFMQDLHSINNVDAQANLTLRRQDLTPQFDVARETKTRAVRTQAIQKKCNDQVVTTVKNSFICGIAFAGMLLTCIPGCQFAGLIVVGMASALYLTKNLDRLHNASRKSFASLFHSTTSPKVETISHRIPVRRIGSLST